MDIESIFSPRGELEKALKGYSFRSGQLEMAELVDSALSDHAHAIIEAGTGTGKSFAYLVPVFLSVARNRSRRFVIATSTITLQKQLFDKDIPLIQRALGMNEETAIVYGRANYLCLRRFNDSRNEKVSAGIKRSESDLAFEEWVTTTDTGVIQDLPQSVDASLFLSFACDDKDCLGYRCPYASECFYFGARRKAQKARVIVTNHHLLLLDADISLCHGGGGML